ncbi:glycosyltransferase [Neobacillus mesonae]|uniref:glycosyltransferase family 2 protein n=1 Tax=Neobacillus mesonae TaxID=1193713 RepID=UPI00203B4F5B|nr:glycosyltransferase [Neobacillus mesonae]MCM3568229.1 glycosyltransferase [Neobacillus mesonae]
MLKLSIVVPIYNVEQYLPNCIESILSQTYKDFEVILVNDGSPDNCGEICENYAKKDNRIKVIHKVNEGVSSARNCGINLSKGEYIGFIDPDDTVEPEMYDVLLQTAKKNNADIVVCPIKTKNFINNTVSISPVWKDVGCVLDQEIIRDYIIPSVLVERTYSLISCVNKVYKKSLFIDNQIRFENRKSHSEDAILNWTLLNKINKLIFIDKPLYNYQINKRDSLTQIFRENFYEYILDNKNFKLEICKIYNLEKYSSTIKNHYVGVTLSFMQNVVIRELKEKKKINILKTIFYDKEFNKDILHYKCPSFYYKLLKRICIHKNVRLFYQIVKFKNMFQYNINRVRKNENKKFN